MRIAKKWFRLGMRLARPVRGDKGDHTYVGGYESLGGNRLNPPDLKECRVGAGNRV